MSEAAYLWALVINGRRLDRFWTDARSNPRVGGWPSWTPFLDRQSCLPHPPRPPQAVPPISAIGESGDPHPHLRGPESRVRHGGTADRIGGRSRVRIDENRPAGRPTPTRSPPRPGTPFGGFVKVGTLIRVLRRLPAVSVSICPCIRHRRPISLSGTFDTRTCLWIVLRGSESASPEPRNRED